MTHDELLDKIYWSWRHQDTEHFGLSGYRNALRAVVELHKPENTILGGQPVCEECTQGAFVRLTTYPCPTIQAIEKELG